MNIPIIPPWIIILGIFAAAIIIADLVVVLALVAARAIIGFIRKDGE